MRKNGAKRTGEKFDVECIYLACIVVEHTSNAVNKLVKE